MLGLRLDEHAAHGTVHLDAAATARHEVTGAQMADKLHRTSDPHFSEVVAILRRRSPLILTIAGIGTLLAIVIGLAIPPRYTAIAQLVVETPSVGDTERTIDESVDTHLTLLGSRDHLQRVIKSLLQDPKFGAATDPKPASSAGLGAQQSVALDQRTDSTAAETTALDELKRRLNVWFGELRTRGSRSVPPIEEFERNTSVIQERRSRVISVAFTSTNPQKAAAFANRIVQLYVNGLTEQNQAWLEEQIAEAKHDTESARNAAQKLIQQQKASGGQRAPDGQLRELLRRAGSTAEHYDNLLRRRKEMRDQQDTVSSGVEIHPAEVPRLPSSHNPILFIFPAFVFFAIGGSWLAVVLERLDRGLRSREETADVLGIPCIGLVPLLPRKRATRPDQHLLAEPYSAYTEAIQSAAVTLGLAAGPIRASKVVLISSSVPEEGKTTLALSLAAYIGVLGRRVLLVAFDLRKASRVDELDDRAGTSIVDLSLRNRPLVELIRHIADARIDYLPMAGSRLDALSLFASDHLPDLIRQLRERYDCVIIDGPPALGAVEARLLPSIVDKLLFVVKWGSTRRELAKNALRWLRDSGCLNNDPGDIATAIVTQVDLKRHARYRFGDIGEVVVRHAKYYSNPMEARPHTGGTEPTATADESQTALGRSFAQRILPMREVELPGMKIEPSRLKMAGDGTDGRSR